MSSQVVRVQGFTKGSLGAIGNEAERNPNVNHRNKDIDPSRTSQNMIEKKTPHGFYAEWNRIVKDLNVQYRDTKNGTAFEGMVITAEKKFFEERFGHKDGQRFSRELLDFWDECYKWAVAEIGFRGTDENIISAMVHADETSLHLQLYYVPITEQWQEKVYAKGEDGKVLRTERGTPIQAKDEDGKTIYRQVEDVSAPKLSRTEFWRARGGQHSYRRMQDSFHEQIGKKYGLERGEIGSDREHRTKNQWEQEQLQAEKAKVAAQIEEYRELKTAVDEIADSGKTVLPGVVAVKKKDHEVIKEQAKAYVANRDEIETLRERQAAVTLREQQAAERERKIAAKERDLARQQKDLAEKYHRQIDINHVLEQTEYERDIALDQNNALTSEVGSLRTELSKTKEKLTAQIEELKNKLLRAYNVLRSVVKAVGMLKYDKDDGYKVEDLDKRQGRLIDGVAEYAAEEARSEGFEDIATDIDQHIGIGREIASFVQDRNGQSHDDGPSGR